MNTKSKKPPKKKRGMPTKYREEFIDQSFIFCSEGGADDRLLSKLFKINRSNLCIWKQKYPEFKKAIKEGKEIYDGKNVEDSLRRRAEGYITTEKHTTTAEDGRKVVKTIKREVTSDVAAIFYLKNRHPDRWKDRKAVDMTANMFVKVIYNTNVPEKE